MNSKELFKNLTTKLPNVEYLFFKWSGGGDDWSGYEFLHGYDDSGKFTDFPIPPENEINNELKSFVIFDELSLTINCVDRGWSEGFLLIALKPLSEEFEYDRFYQDSGFKGFAIEGRNHEEFFDSINIEQNN